MANRTFKRKSSKNQIGGKKGKRKSKKAPSAWNKHLMKVYREMKKQDKSIKLKDAMSKAAETYKK